MKILIIYQYLQRVAYIYVSGVAIFFYIIEYRYRISFVVEFFQLVTRSDKIDIVEYISIHIKKIAGNESAESEGIF